MAKRTPGLEQVNLILPKSIHAMGTKVETLYRRHFVLWHWPDVVGNVIAEHVKPMGIEHGRLWLYTMDSSWRNEIQMMQMEILQKVNQFAGERLVHEMRFGRMWESREGSHAGPMKENNKIALKRDIQKINLTEKELGELKKTCSTVEDEELQGKLYTLLRNQRKLEKWKKSLEWHPCADCGTLCPKEARRCGVCESLHRKEVRETIRGILRELPWMRYGEIRAQVPESTPYMVNSLRASMTQELAKAVTFGDAGSIGAKRLTMLHLCLPPEQLTEDIVRRTLYRFRKDLSPSEGFRPVRRCDCIPSGKRKAGKKHVPSSGK